MIHKLKKKKRVARGHSSGHGKTACRGHKGQKSRSGGTKAGFEGGQTPLYRRLPKGMKFKNYPFRKIYSVLNLSDLKRFEPEDNVTIDSLRKMFFKDDSIIKILGMGEINRPITVSAHAFSKTAKQKIEGSGGKCLII